MRKVVVIGFAISFAAAAAVTELSSSHQSSPPTVQAREFSPATSTAPSVLASQEREATPESW